MTALDWINMGMQTILPSVIGWLLVLLVLKDARHRAWASLITLAVVVTLLLLPLWNGTSEDSQATNLSTWRPEWKMTLSEPAPVLAISQMEQTIVEPASWNWPHWSALLAWIWCGVGIAILLLHLWRTLTTKWWQRTLPIYEKEGVQVRVAKEIGSPCLAGVLKPEIVVPQRALESWSPQQWRWTLMHEREHLRGGDALIAWCLGWVRAVLWWNPFIHRLIGEWEQAREEICDRAAAAKVDDAAPYSEFLLAVADGSRSPGVSMAVSRPVKRLKARLVSLLEHRKVRRWPHWSFLVLICGLSVLWISLAGCVSLERTQDPADEGPLMTRSFKVAPDFLSAFEETKTHLTAQEGLKSYGVDFPAGASAVFNATASQLIVKNTKRRLDQVESLVGALKARQDFKHIQIYINTKWIEMPTKMPTLQDLSTLTHQQFQSLMKSMNQQEGVDLMNSPNITTRIGQRATIEVLYEMQTSTAKADFSGVRGELVPMIHDGKIQISLVADIGTAFRGGKRLWRKFDTDDKAVTIRHLIRRETAAMKNGETLVVHLGEPVKGRKVVLFLTSALINPSGQSVPMKEAISLQAKGDFKSVASVKQPGAANSEAQVRLNATLFEMLGDFLPAEVDGTSVRDEKNFPISFIDTLFPSKETEALRKPVSEPKFEPIPRQVPPAVMALSGILTPEQFRKTAAAWKADPKTKVGEAFSIARSGGKVQMVLGGGSDVTILPELGADGYTIDLNITPTLRSNGQTRQVTTSITIWDQQTVLLGGVMEAGPDGKPQRSQILAITAQIVK